MAHGYPDYGVSHPKEELYAGVDLAELAARLGALPRYDRLGDVIFYEDFGGDLGAWEQEDSGAGETAEVTAARKVSGSFSCRMRTAAALGSYIGLLGRFPVPFSVKYGAEWQWTLDTNMDYAYVLIDIYTGAYHLAFGIRGDIATGQNYYWGPLGAWVALPIAGVPYANDRNFIVDKFTFDISTVRYSRLLIPPLDFDLSAYPGFAFPDVVTRPRMEIRGRIYSTGLPIATSYVDSLIVTANDV